MESPAPSDGLQSRPGRGRPALAPGEHGNVETSSWVRDNKTGVLRRKRMQGDSRLRIEHWTAEASVGTESGRRKRVQARGRTAAEATAALQVKLNPPEVDHLAEALRVGASHADLSDRSTLGQVLDAWISDPATLRTRAPGTILRYRHAISTTIKSRRVGSITLGAAPLTKLTPRALSLFLSSLSPAVGKTCRGILRQALTYAIANGATVPTTNGAFAMLSQRIDRSPDGPNYRSVPIAREQANEILLSLRGDKATAKTDLPDIVLFLCGTGARIGETLALTYGQLKLSVEPPTVIINATVNGLGQRQPHPKTGAGVRRLALPPQVAQMLIERRSRATGDLVFPSRRQKNDTRPETPLWGSNVTSLVRQHLDRLGYEGISAKSFRKMVATELDKAGYSARQIADQLGHSRPSVTMDVYWNREAAGPESVANVLAAIGSEQPGTTP